MTPDQNTQKIRKRKLPQDKDFCKADHSHTQHLETSPDRRKWVRMPVSLLIFSKVLAVVAIPIKKIRSIKTGRGGGKGLFTDDMIFCVENSRTSALQKAKHPQRNTVGSNKLESLGHCQHSEIILFLYLSNEQPEKENCIYMNIQKNEFNQRGT